MTVTKWLSQAKRGLLELCILNIVSQESMYGYQLVKRLRAVPGLVVTVGTIYPRLSRLKREGLLTSMLVESPRGPARRVYALSASGRRHMRTINEAWQEISHAVSEFMDAKEDKS